MHIILTCNLQLNVLYRLLSCILVSVENAQFERNVFYVACSWHTENTCDMKFLLVQISSVAGENGHVIDGDKEVTGI